MENLYLIKCNEFYKIGIANDLQSRIASLQTGNPYPLVVVACFEFTNAGVMERALHEKFSSVRKLGEWFTLGESAVEEFVTLCKMLGGHESPVRSELVDQEVIEEAEEIQEAALDNPDNKWDFQAMFADGWCMEPSNSKGKKYYWVWRKRRGGENGYLYGGRIADLPFPNLDEMRRIFRDGKLYQPYIKKVVEAWRGE